MRSIADPTGRFPERPFYKESELDSLFENLVVQFLKRRRGAVEFPLTTDELTILIEKDVNELDLYADLTRYGHDVEGMTEFVPGGLPRVAISAALSEQPSRLNRHRTTLAHEYGHVKLHAYLFDLPRSPSLGLAGHRSSNAIYCKREAIVSAAKSDWMEWQAGYACGAVLMPRSHLLGVVAEYQRERGLFGPTSSSSADGQAMIEVVCGTFQVSRDAARVRLERLAVLGEPRAMGSLFG